MSKKYEFTGKEKKILGLTFKQIVCVPAFASIAVGYIGGRIESESILDQSGKAQVFGDAQVLSGDAWVSENARVFD